MYSVRAGRQDWLAIWRQMYDVERAQGEAATDPEFGRHPDPWASRAKRFAAASRRQSQPDRFMELLLPQLRPDDTVIDLGAGSGRYLPILAPACAQLIAIEPSPAMRTELERTVADAGLSNVTILSDFWPLNNSIVADVIISAHVAYGIREIGPFFTAMNAAARRSCYLYLGLRPPSATLAPFWERVHGEPRLPLPGALEALNCLHQLGIYASLELVPVSGSFRFSSLDEALDEIRHRMRLSPRPDRDAKISSAIRELLVDIGNGELTLLDQPAYAGVIGWRPA